MEARHTLVYDSLISEASSPQLLASVTVPVLVLDSQGSDDDLGGVAATAAGSIPNRPPQSRGRMARGRR